MDSFTEYPGQYRPLSHRYDTIDRRYKFFKLKNAACMQMHYPLIKDEMGRHISQILRENQDDNYQEFENEQEISEISITINDLSDDILLTIFDCCHPIDLINCCSLVSHRWNNLVNHSTALNEVRVLVTDYTLAHKSVKEFFGKNSQRLRKLCIDCAVTLPSTQVNGLFVVRMPNVTHLDISSFDEMDATLLKKLSRCFPNLDTLHMEGVRRCSSRFRCEGEWNQILELLFEDENTFPKIENFFVGDLNEYWNGSGSKLLAWKRSLKILHIENGAARVNFYGIITSPWRFTLTELYLGYFITNHDFRHIGLLHNLKILSLDMCLYTNDEDILHLKATCGDHYCNLTTVGMIDLFTLPDREPEKSFPYKLRNLALTEFQMCSVELIYVIAQNCPKLRTLNLQHNEHMGDDIMYFITRNFSDLVLLDLSKIGKFYDDEVWDHMCDDILPNLRFLRLHDNGANIEILQRLNLRRPKLLITTKLNHFINWTETENGCIFHDAFDGDISALINDLSQIDGFGCCGTVSSLPLSSISS
ncbi:F-box domain protein [Onchocerca flexuosa]|uniref:F-box domain protein n=1 Tax=Onchocerca flexuosa TaxID=387005 RepID=A0A238C559_9BILA|nr:F-box domain protein [Onchocerca flexuosa]